MACQYVGCSVVVWMPSIFLVKLWDLKCHIYPFYVVLDQNDEFFEQKVCKWLVCILSLTEKRCARIAQLRVQRTRVIVIDRQETLTLNFRGPTTLIYFFSYKLIVTVGPRVYFSMSATGNKLVNGRWFVFYRNSNLASRTQLSTFLIKLRTTVCLLPNVDLFVQ